MFEPLPRLALGLLTGIIFGFFLQKGQVAKFDVIIRQLMLKDSTVFKIMLSAVMVGSVGIYFLLGQQAIDLSIKPAAFAALLIGGAIFGLGMAVFGYCPGTSVAASGAGQKDAMVGVVGMVFGAAAYVGFYGQLKPLSDLLGNWGKITLPELTHTSAWWWVAGLWVCGLLSFYLLEKHKQSVTSLTKEERALVNATKH